MTKGIFDWLEITEVDPEYDSISILYRSGDPYPVIAWRLPSMHGGSYWVIEGGRGGLHSRTMVDGGSGDWEPTHFLPILIFDPLPKLPTAVRCTVCGMRKKPIGRDSRDNGLCGHDCPGYREEPIPSHLWPGESDD